MFSPLTLSEPPYPAELSAFCVLSCVHCPWWDRVHPLSSLWNHVNSLYHSSHTRKPSWEHQLLLWCKRNCIELLFVTAPSFPLLHVTEFLRIPPQLLHFRSCILSPGSSPHPSICFSHSPISSFHSKAWDSLEAFVMEINKEL